MTPGILRIALASVLGSLAITLLSSAQPIVIAPATAPASQPTRGPTASAKVIRTYLERLADRDAIVRERASEDLMGLSFADLPTLLNVIKESRPLRPSQAAVLREIVSHIYISGQTFPRLKDDMPFLGIYWGNAQDNVGDGISIGIRYPGFPAYRMLRDGDIITGIVERPGEAFGTRSFSEAITAFEVAQTIHLEVLRDGRTIRVPITLGTRPALSPDQLTLWESEQQAAADQYWEDNFASLVDDTIS